MVWPPTPVVRGFPGSGVTATNTLTGASAVIFLTVGDRGAASWGGRCLCAGQHSRRASRKQRINSFKLRQFAASQGWKIRRNVLIMKAPDLIALMHPDGG